MLYQRLGEIDFFNISFSKATVFQKKKVDQKFDKQPQSSGKRDREVFIYQKLQQINPSKFFILKILPIPHPYPTISILVLAGKWKFKYLVDEHFIEFIFWEKVAFTKGLFTL